LFRMWGTNVDCRNKGAETKIRKEREKREELAHHEWACRSPVNACGEDKTRQESNQGSYLDDQSTTTQ